MTMWTAMKNCRKCYRAEYATFEVWEKKTEPVQRDLRRFFSCRKRNEEEGEK